MERDGSVRTTQEDGRLACLLAYSMLMVPTPHQSVCDTRIQGNRFHPSSIHLGTIRSCDDDEVASLRASKVLLHKI